MPASKTIFIAAAGTGGHVFPALVIAEQARAQGMKIIWIGTEQGLEKRVVPKAGFELITTKSSKVVGKSIFKKLIGILNLCRATCQVMRLIKKFKPDYIIGFGGYITMPAGLAAKLKRVPLILHEQNAIAGLSNRLLAKMAKTVCLGFPNSIKTKNAVFVGNPIRQEIINLHKDNIQDDSTLKLLIVGGSQGARPFNNILPDAIALALKEKKIDVWHQTGAAQYPQVKLAYEQLGVDANVKSFIKVMPFIEDMAGAYQWADLIICRAGALTVTEVMTVGLAAIFVPFPQAIHDHQTANANYLVEQKAALLLPQEQFSPTTVATLLLNLNKTELNCLATQAKSLRRIDASDTILAHII